MAADYPTLADQQRFWDSKWQTEAIGPWSLQRGEALLRLLRTLPLARPKILDLGCGTGWFTAKLAEFGQATGIDLSPEGINQATSRFPRATFLAGNLFKVPLPAAHFDVVVSQQVIAHVENQVAYLELAAAALKPGGYLLITTANRFVIERLDWPPQPPEHIEQWLNMRGLKRLLKPRFRILHTTSLLPIGDGGILRVLNSYKLNRILGFVIPRHSLDALKERAGLGYTLIALAQKRP
jgi:SAM-dependent methyltransferase